MAVSGRKVSDFSRTLSCGSTEVVDPFCDPCLTTGHKVDAHKYCVECEEYLCRNCSDCHLKTKASRNHQLVDKDKDSNQPMTKDSDLFTEKCPEHEQEVLKYFCPQHEALGCHVCMIMYHKTCEVDYIPDKCKDIANSEELRRTVFRLYLKLLELEKITQSTQERDQWIDKYYQNLLQEIQKFREEINQYLDQLEQKIQKEADKKKTEDKQITKRIIDGCNCLSSDIKNMQTTIQANETSGKYGQLYITVKQAQSALKSDKIQAVDGLERTAQQYIFERNDSLMNTLFKQDAIGKLTLASVIKIPRKKMKNFDKLSKQEDINVLAKSDEKDCWITGCSALSPNKLVLADMNNSKLKLVNIQTKSVIEETSLDSTPWDVAVLSQDQIAVTMPEKRQVVIMTCGDKLSTVHTISVIGKCYGIIYQNDQLYLICGEPLCVLILDKDGNELHTISLNKEIFSDPRYIEVSEDSKLLYISDWHKKCVVSITLQGEVTAVYKHEELVEPEGMLMLDDGSLLVCNCYNNSLRHVSGDLKQGQEVVEVSWFPHSICYNHHRHEIYIGSISCDKLTVFIPQ